MKITFEEKITREVEITSFPAYRKTDYSFFKVIDEKTCIWVHESFDGETDSVSRSSIMLAYTDKSTESNKAEFNEAFERVGLNLASLVNGD